MRTGWIQRRATLIGLATAALALAGGAASAGAQTVTVTDLGQPGMISEVPQPPFAVTAHGTCALARTLQEAGGGVSPCPAGTWPAPGGAGWAPTLAVAEGDAIALDFETPPDDLLVTVTTNADPTVRPPPAPTMPDGTVLPVLNPGGYVAQEFGPVVSHAGEDPRRWIVTVPRLTAFPFPIAIAVTAVTSGSGENFPFALATPRWSVFDSRCGQSWEVPGPPRQGCPRDAVPPGVPSGIPTGPSVDTPVSRPDVVRQAPRPVRPAPTLRLATTHGAPLRIRGTSVAVPLRTSGAGRLQLRLRWHGRLLGSCSAQVRRAGEVTVRVPLDGRRLAALRQRRTRVLTLGAQLAPRAGAAAGGSTETAQLTRAIRVRTR